MLFACNITESHVFLKVTIYNGFVRMNVTIFASVHARLNTLITIFTVTLQFKLQADGKTVKRRLSELMLGMFIKLKRAYNQTSILYINIPSFAQLL